MFDKHLEGFHKLLGRIFCVQTHRHTQSVFHMFLACCLWWKDVKAF